MINLLKEKNVQLINEYEKRGDFKLVTKHKIIEQILEKDNCFEELSFEQAADILISLGVKDWKAAYVKLLSK